MSVNGYIPISIFVKVTTGATTALSCQLVTLNPKPETLVAREHPGSKLEEMAPAEVACRRTPSEPNTA